jgi:iron complex transport system permease protein
LFGLVVLLLVVCILRIAIGTGGVGWPQGSATDAAVRLLVRYPLAGAIDTIAGYLPVETGDAWHETARRWRGAEAVSIAEIRMLRLLAGLLVGVALAVSGVALQALLRNPLAEPFLLGLSSGAAVGVMVQMLIGYTLGRMLGGNHVGAVIGAAASMVIVFLASRRHGTIDPLGLLLTGVVLSSVNGAIIMLLQYIVGPGGLKENLARWMMGYIDEGVGTSAVMPLMAMTVGMLALLMWRGRAMDVATLSETEAASIGVNLPRLRTLLFVAASMLAAGAVVVAGPIAFVGLICPHFARLLFGPTHRRLLFASAVLGAMLVVSADTLSAFLAYRFDVGMLPIGIFTAMLGGPAFLYMLRPQLGRGME